ncbi:predicted protein [Sclerotinia sclerotiorum 1980 UF-70]|uniref:Uncharacterized protein n=1 Tax=Sclerotinia sclerotiorum (strain ATCC 18683 / 1980 / Ss-1) TaxID=665079 RepID=A7EBI7_SCLS1|nr:predicted protein [Sclerotinia sclerotiorum 1980 UF-70]EDN99815.1 predicted protein [Sclerotinia sclerotiorum 1980 UF-70]
MTNINAPPLTTLACICNLTITFKGLKSRLNLKLSTKLLFAVLKQPVRPRVEDLKLVARLIHSGKRHHTECPTISAFAPVSLPPGKESSNRGVKNIDTHCTGDHKVLGVSNTPKLQSQQQYHFHQRIRNAYAYF